MKRWKKFNIDETKEWQAKHFTIFQRLNNKQQNSTISTNEFNESIKHNVIIINYATIQSFLFFESFTFIISFL